MPYPYSRDQWIEFSQHEFCASSEAMSVYAKVYISMRIEKITLSLCPSSCHRFRILYRKGSTGNDTVPSREGMNVFDLDWLSRYVRSR